jgi:hypothetical protein
VERFFTCAHFCPTYREVILQFQNFTFMSGPDDDEMWGQRFEIIMCIPKPVFMYGPRTENFQGRHIKKID